MATFEGKRPQSSGFPKPSMQSVPELRCTNGLIATSVGLLGIIFLTCAICVRIFFQQEEIADIPMYALMFAGPLMIIFGFGYLIYVTYFAVKPVQTNCFDQTKQEYVKETDLNNNDDVFVENYNHMMRPPHLPTVTPVSRSSSMRSERVVVQQIPQFEQLPPNRSARKCSIDSLPRNFSSTPHVKTTQPRSFNIEPPKLNRRVSDVGSAYSTSGYTNRAMDQSLVTEV